MRFLPELFEKNEAWARHLRDNDPDYFNRLAAEQHPRILWIGCADSRVPPNEIVDLHAGDLFVHRNIANIVAPGDVNILSVLQYAVEALEVEHVIVCGHYGCGGVRAALDDNARRGPLSVWIDHVGMVQRRHRVELADLDDERRFARLCELNTRAQVEALSASSIVLDAWERGQNLFLHAWIYDLSTGQLTDLHEDREAEGTA